MSPEVGTQPALLDRPGAARHSHAVRIQRDDMPGADVIAVVAPPTPAGAPVRRTRPIEVVEIGVSRSVVVAEHWMADGRDAPPGSVVDRLEVRRRRAVVLDLAEREHRSNTGPDEKVRVGTLPTAVRSPPAAVIAGVAWVAGDVA